MKSIYLPKLIKIKVEAYSLYINEPTFEFEFLNGISAIVGVNGIGKTSFVEMILYAILGFKTKIKKSRIEYENEDYFRVRMSNKVDYNRNAKVCLEYKLSNRTIEIERSLNENSIISLKIDNNAQPDLSEDYYKNKILEMSCITEFSYFEKMVRYFLVFDELRTNIAWETDTQDEILRIILFEKERFKEFEEIEQLITKEDSRGRHASEEKRMLTESTEELENENEKVNRNKDSNDNFSLGDLYSKKNSLIEQRDSANSKIEDISQTIEDDIRELDVLGAKIDNAKALIETTDKKIMQFENVLYKKLYDSVPDVYFDIEKSLIEKGECLICGACSKKIKSEAQQKSKDNICQVCNSSIVSSKEVSGDIVQKINELYDHRMELINEIKNLNVLVAERKAKVNTYNEQIVILRNENEFLNKELFLVDTYIAKIEGDSDQDRLQRILIERQKKIEELEKRKDEAYLKRDYYKRELEKRHRKFRQEVEELNTELSKYFNKYASTFLGVECELTVQKKVINKIPHVIYLPKINGDTRKDIWSVSESQRFFIDQAFRMAIIDFLKNNIKGFETFFITETPEGSLDISYEAYVAKMFIVFAKSDNNIVFTSNLNSSNFLYGIFKGIDKKEASSRILNLLDKGNRTNVQKSYKREFDEIIMNIMGG